jgi:hypothetical protein
MEHKTKTLTEFEKEFLRKWRQSYFWDGDAQSTPWVWSVLDEIKMFDASQGRGVISSLVQKKVLDVWDNGGKGRAADMVCRPTSEGFMLMALMGMTEENPEGNKEEPKPTVVTFHPETKKHPDVNFNYKIKNQYFDFRARNVGDANEAQIQIDGAVHTDGKRNANYFGIYVDEKHVAEFIDAILPENWRIQKPDEHFVFCVDCWKRIPIEDGWMSIPHRCPECQEHQPKS